MLRCRRERLCADRCRATDGRRQHKAELMDVRIGEHRLHRAQEPRRIRVVQKSRGIVNRIVQRSDAR